ncbi:MAG: SDR family NAD(P)-dependent oxidoreductase, partial [Myxococcota bacterium]
MLDASATSLTGKVALVTGGGGGMGRAIAETFAAHGARVTIAEIDAQRAAETLDAITKAGGQARAWVVDIREKSGVDEFISGTLEEFGRVDVLVNNVG